MPLSETVLVITALLATGIVASGLFRQLPVPYTVVLVLIGMALSSLSHHWQPLEPLQHFHLTPDLVLFIFLPALIFESGLNLNSRQLIKDIAPVLMLAVPALLFSTAAVGLGIWLLLPIDLPVALLFGALISATDPVAVIALFKELGTPERLTVLVEGESLLNDATAIVVVGILLGLASMTGTPAEIAFAAVAQFFLVFFGGILIGCVFGFIISWLMSHYSHEASAVLILSLVLAYMSFVVAEHTLHVSGVMAVVACAIIFGIFGIARLPQNTIEIMHETWEFIAHICNTLLFLFIGMLVDIDSLLNDSAAIILAVLLVQASRASMIYSLVPLTEKLFSLPHVTLGERHIMFWGGLKGGLALAIVLALPADLPGRETLISLTLGVVLFTLLFNAPTIRPLIKKLGLDELSNDERAELKRGLVSARQAADELLARFRLAGVLNRANQHKIRQMTHDTVDRWIPDVVGDDAYRHHRLSILRAERNELENLLRSGALKQFVYLDLLGELQRKRDHVVAEGRLRQRHDNDGTARPNTNIFLRLEDALVKFLREADWAAGLFSRYQNRRMTSHLMRDIARILMAETALLYLADEKDIDADHRRQLELIYQNQLTYFRKHLNNICSSFPDFFDRFENNLCSRAALIAASQTLEHAYHQGSITAKVHNWLTQHLQPAIDDLPPISARITDLQPEKLISMMPLFSALPPAVIQQISETAKPVNYLQDDTIIGAGEHGDALFIIMQGRVEVLVRQDGNSTAVAELAAGDFFGEMALLGDQIRSADVIAITACTLLRIRAREVMELGKRFPEITHQLDLARQQRDQ